MKNWEFRFIGPLDSRVSCIDEWLSEIMNSYPDGEDVVNAIEAKLPNRINVYENAPDILKAKCIKRMDRYCSGIDRIRITAGGYRHRLMGRIYEQERLMVVAYCATKGATKRKLSRTDSQQFDKDCCDEARHRLALWQEGKAALYDWIL